MFFQNHSNATGVSELEYWRFNSSIGTVAFGRASRGCFALGASATGSSSSSSTSLAFGFGCSFFGAASFLGGWYLIGSEMNSSLGTTAE